jgi:hypothetical protein
LTSSIIPKSKEKIDTNAKLSTYTMTEFMAAHKVRKTNNMKTENGMLLILVRKIEKIEVTF